MMRILLVPALALLAGCADLSTGAFDQGPASMERFTMDGRTCQQYAEGERYFTVRGIDAGPFQKGRIYDKAFAQCMQRLGYQKRAGWYEFSLGFDW